MAAIECAVIKAELWSTRGKHVLTSRRRNKIYYFRLGIKINHQYRQSTLIRSVFQFLLNISKMIHENAC